MKEKTSGLLGRGIVAACFGCLLAPSSGLAQTQVQDADLSQVYQQAASQVKVSKEANGAPELTEALDLQNHIRGWLADNGQRVTKELLAEVHQDFSSSAGFLLFGIVGASSGQGSYDARQYEDLLGKGGDRYIITTISDNSLRFLDVVEKTPSNGLQKCVAEMRDKFQQLSATKKSLPQIKGVLARFQTLLTSLQAQEAEGRLTPKSEETVNQLVTWAKNSRVIVKEIEFNTYDVGIKTAWNVHRGTIYLGIAAGSNCDQDHTFAEIAQREGTEQFPPAIDVVNSSELRIY